MGNDIADLLILAQAHGQSSWVAGDMALFFKLEACGLEKESGGFGFEIQPAVPVRPQGFRPHLPFRPDRPARPARLLLHHDHYIATLDLGYGEVHEIGPGRRLCYVRTMSGGQRRLYEVILDVTIPELDPKVYPSQLAALMESQYLPIREYVLHHLIPTAVLADDDVVSEPVPLGGFGGSLAGHV